MTLKQWDWVYAWNYKYPDKKTYTRFLHRLDNIKPSNICVSADTVDTYPQKVNLRRYDMVAPAKEQRNEAIIDWKRYQLIPV
jgi:hypothetical protein